MNFLLVMQLLQVFLLCPYIQVHEFPLSNAITYYKYSCMPAWRQLSNYALIMLIILIMLMVVVGQTCQTNNGGCDHICTNTSTGVQCSCRNGYWLISGQICRGEVTIFNSHLKLHFFSDRY